MKGFEEIKQKAEELQRENDRLKAAAEKKDLKDQQTNTDPKIMVHEGTETDPIAMVFEENKVEPRERRSVSVSIEKCDSGNLVEIQHVFTAQQARKKPGHRLAQSVS